MISLDERLFPANAQTSQKIQTLIVGRLLIIFLLLVSSWIWHGGRFKLTAENFPQGLFFVFLISVGLTIIYFAFVRFNKNYGWQVRAQFFLDALLTTWLVSQTGDLTSPYITLYIVLIAVSSIFLPAKETLLLSLFNTLLFAALSILGAMGKIPSANQNTEGSKLVQIIGFHTVAFLIVGLLASRLSERQASGEKLKETAKTLADLRVLHERIIESIRSGLVTTDLDGNIYSFNAAATEITGYSPEQMLGKPVVSLLGNFEDSVRLSLELTETGDHQKPRFETDLITPDGFAVRVGYGISPLFSEQGEETGLIVTFQDLTEIRSMEESVRRKDRLAAVGRVAAGLAHEIRNPLGAMRGAIQVLQTSIPPDTSQAKLMDIVLRESDRLNKIITNFLTYARPRVSNFSETDVCEAIRDTFTLLRHSPDVKEIHRLETALPDCPVIISADPTQLKQIFWNLARNAIMAMPDGGTFRVAVEEVPNSRIKILFEDSGCGMSPTQVEQLFEPFSDSTTGGTGLGLSIVYQIIRDHNGTINVRSIENEGTTITVELPCESRSQNSPNEGEIIENQSASTLLKNYLKVKDEKSKISS